MSEGWCYDCNELVPLDDEGCCKHCGGANVVLDDADAESAYPQPAHWFFTIPFDDPHTTHFKDPPHPAL